MEARTLRTSLSDAGVRSKNCMAVGEMVLVEQARAPRTFKSVQEEKRALKNGRKLQERKEDTRKEEKDRGEGSGDEAPTQTKDKTHMKGKERRSHPMNTTNNTHNMRQATCGRVTTEEKTKGPKDEREDDSQSAGSGCRLQKSQTKVAGNKKHNSNNKDDEE